METSLQVLDILKLTNPKPPYECHSIRRNPDLITLQHNEPDLFQDSYSEYVMRSGTTVYTREIEIKNTGWYEDGENNTELEIISKEDYESLPVRSDGVLAKFEKLIQQKVWEARKNGINHYQPWHDPVYYFDDIMKKIEVPQLEFRTPTSIY